MLLVISPPETESSIPVVDVRRALGKKLLENYYEKRGAGQEEIQEVQVNQNQGGQQQAN